MRIIFWGYKLHTDTLSYVFEAMKRSLDNLGYETLWLEDAPNNYSFSDDIFISEGKGCRYMPLNKDCTYLIHYLHQPERFIGNVKKIIDLRYLVSNLTGDPQYSYSFNKNECEKLDSGTYYEYSDEYDKVYMAWATNLLPHEIDLEYRKIKRKNIFNFIGTISESSGYGQKDELTSFVSECTINKIQFNHFDPWIRPVSNEDLIRLTQESFLAPDIRGPKHKICGVLPCRIFKNISYGQLGLTNSNTVYEFLEKQVIYSEDPRELFYLGKANMDNLKLIQEQMVLVKTKHTYINRMSALMKVIR